MLTRVSCAEDENGNLFEIPKCALYILQKLTGVESPRALALLTAETMVTEGLTPRDFSADQAFLWMAQKYNLLKEIKK